MDIQDYIKYDVESTEDLVTRFQLNAILNELNSIKKKIKIATVIGAFYVMSQTKMLDKIGNKIKELKTMKGE